MSARPGPGVGTGGEHLTLALRSVLGWAAACGAGAWQRRRHPRTPRPILNDRHDSFWQSHGHQCRRPGGREKGAWKIGMCCGMVPLCELNGASHMTASAQTPWSTNAGYMGATAPSSPSTLSAKTANAPMRVLNNWPIQGDAVEPVHRSAVGTHGLHRPILRVALHEPNHPPRAPALNDPHIISNQPSLEAGAGGHTERLTAALVFTFGVLPVFP